MSNQKWLTPIWSGLTAQKDPTGKTGTRNQSFDGVFVVDARL
jgi:hypothetical protein